MRNQAGMFTGLGPVKASGQCDPGKTVRSRYIWDTVNERAVRILQECILVNSSRPMAIFYAILNKRRFFQESGCAKVANLAIRWIQWYCKIRQERNSNL